MEISRAFSLFRDAVMTWHDEHPRHLPWKETDDPYRIWLSEIILQQTQIVQGIPYYERFVSKYPTVQDLASASESEILNEWQGLGYNSRARNLRKAAIMVCEDHDGYFPETYDGLLTLSGVGSYTAAAIASFAFGQHIPVIDVNVVRILCRYWGIEELPERSAVRAKMRTLLKELIEGLDPAEFNQGIMNFGALQCVPKNPNCLVCPLKDQCVAFNTGMVAKLPRPKIRKPRRERFFHYLVVMTEWGVVMRHRTESDIWQGMYDFPMKEMNSADLLSTELLRDWAVSIGESDQICIGDPIHDLQLLTHQKLHCVFYPCAIGTIREISPTSNLIFVEFKILHKFAVPKIIDCYFRVKSILL